MSAADLFARDFDDLEAGIRAETDTRTITERDLASFSALTGDWHRQHSDADWAERSVFGERIAHGMLVLSYAIGMLPIDDERIVALRGVDKVVFKRPAPIGSTIHACAELLSTKPLDDEHGLVEIRLDVRDAKDRLLLRGAIEALWRRGRNDRNREVDATDDVLAPVAHGQICI